MKHYLYVLAFLLSFHSADAQYATPGNHKSWTLDSLVAYSGGVVTGGPEIYFFNSNLTLSATDTLSILQNITVKIAAACTVTVAGIMLVDPPEEVIFTAIDTTANYAGFRFDNSPSSWMRHARFEFGGGNKIIGSDMIFEYCTFRKNGSAYASGALDILQCNPVIQNCTFFLNNRAAIMSSANAAASPKIIANHIYHNDVSNGNYPQINLGTGSADTLIIRDNLIEGLYTNAGGIGISNLTGTGQLLCRVENNHIFNNRYGMAFLGYPVSGLVLNNRIENNNIQNNPNLGGSGINFNGNASTNQLIVSNNTINGNLWGITIQGKAQPILGDLSNLSDFDNGHNIIYNNGNSGKTFALYNNTTQPIRAENNFWGSVIRDSVERYIVHKTDIDTLGFVDYLPIWDTAAKPTLFIDTITLVRDTIHVGGEAFNQLALTNIGNQSLIVTLKDTFGLPTSTKPHAFQSKKSATKNFHSAKLKDVWRKLKRTPFPADLLTIAAHASPELGDWTESTVTTDPANDFNGRPHNIPGLTYPDAVSIDLSINTFIITTMPCTVTFSAPVDTNMVGVISLDTDQDFMTGMYPPLANLGVSNTDVGSEYELIFTTKPSLYYQYQTFFVPAVLIKWAGDTVEIAGAALSGITRSGNQVRFTVTLLSSIDTDNTINLASGFIEVDSTFDVFSFDDYEPKHIPDAAPDLGHGRLGMEKDPSWFSMDLPGDTLSPAASGLISFMTLGSVPPGSYQATAILKTNDQNQSVMKYPYYLTVLPELQPQVNLAPLAVTDTVPENGFSTVNVLLHNNGPGDFKFFIMDTAGTSWLTITPRAGLLSAGADLQISVRLSAESGLPAGHYTTDILVISNDTLHTVTGVPVQMTVTSSVGVSEYDSRPGQFELMPNYPNPFNPSTVIRYQLAVNSKVTLKIYNILGQEVYTLVDREQPAGPYTVVWNGRDHYGNAVSNGVYLYRLQAGEFVKTRKMILVK